MIIYPLLVNINDKESRVWVWVRCEYEYGKKQKCLYWKQCCERAQGKERLSTSLIWLTRSCCCHQIFCVWHPKSTGPSPFELHCAGKRSCGNNRPGQLVPLCKQKSPWHSVNIFKLDSGHKGKLPEELWFKGTLQYHGQTPDNWEIRKLVPSVQHLYNSALISVIQHLYNRCPEAPGDMQGLGDTDKVVVFCFSSSLERLKGKEQVIISGLKQKHIKILDFL